MKLSKPNELSTIPFELLKDEISQAAIEFNTQIKLGKITVSERNKFIDNIIPKFQHLLTRPECGFRDKILIKSSISALEKSKSMPVKK